LIKDDKGSREIPFHLKRFLVKHTDNADAR